MIALSAPVPNPARTRAPSSARARCCRTSACAARSTPAARELLGATPPPLEDYFPSLMRYARDANWGKEPSPRWDAASAQRAA